ncbi:AAA family ATPase, partial [Bacillus cereus]|nr:AAA family ATPase [Bacillus cereus]
FFFNTITSKDGIDDLEKTFKKIRKELSSDFTIEGYMRRKKVSYEKALKWYEKKKKKMIDFDIDVELGIYSRKNAIIEVANLKKVYYLGLNVKQKIEFHKKYNHLVDELFPAIHEVNKRDEILHKQLYERILRRFEENEFEDFKFIRVVELHESGQPHYHFLCNRYVSHYLMKKITVEGVSEVYDNAYIVDHAMERNKTLTYDTVDTDIVSFYVSKVTRYVTKETIETFSELEKEGDIAKKLISSSNCIKLFDEKDEEESKYKKLGVYDYQINATSYEVPKVLENSVEDFIKFHSVMLRDQYAIDLLKFSKSLDLDDFINCNYVIHERLIQVSVAEYKNKLSTVFDETDLTKEQLELLKSFVENKITLLLGRAGTGKTYTLVNLLKKLKPNPRTTFILTYTGKASVRIKELLSQHELTEYKPMTVHKACSSNWNSNFLKNEYNNLECEYLIIDEVGMIPRDILMKVLLAVPSYTKIIFAGDDAQLPPVNDSSVIPELEGLDFINTIRLTKVFRSGDTVLELAYKVLNRELIDFRLYDEKQLEKLVLPLVEQGYQILTNTKKMTKKINLIVQANKDKITKCFNDYCYEIGDRVMIIANDSSRRVYNGDTGKIVDYDDKGILIQLDFEDRQVFYRYLDTVNIVPAYAFTVHKSQGSEYENVAVFLESQPKLNTNNLLYTGITRAKKNIKVYVPDEKVLSTMINCVPEPVSNITLNNVFDLVNGILDIKKTSSMG